MTISQAQKDPGILQTVSLLTAYCFDLRGLAPVQVINGWLAEFSSRWIRLAVIEALYLGRYKAVSVEHLLQFWHKRGQPNFHFSAEFERMVSQNLPRSLVNTAAIMEELAGFPDVPPPVQVPLTLANSRPISTTKATELRAEPRQEALLARSGTPPSIEQFIPVTAESDLLHRLQSLLPQTVKVS